MLKPIKLSISAIISAHSNPLIRRLRAYSPQSWEHDTLQIQILRGFHIPSLDVLPSYSTILSQAASQTRPFPVAFTTPSNSIVTGDANLCIEVTDELKALQDRLLKDVSAVDDPPPVLHNLITTKPRLMYNRFNLIRSHKHRYAKGMDYLENVVGLNLKEGLGSVRIEGLRWSTLQLWKAPEGESFKNFWFDKMDGDRDPGRDTQGKDDLLLRRGGLHRENFGAAKHQKQHLT